jgi:hypothetical protein
VKPTPPAPTATPLAVDDDGVRTETDIVTVQAMTEGVDYEPLQRNVFANTDTISVTHSLDSPKD